MSVYRLHPVRARFMRFLLEADEVEEKLGEDCVFHMDPTPRPYANVWRPLRIVFHAASGSRAREIPDLDVRQGRLFLSERACKLLREDLRDSGELLPVTYDGGTGWLLNILRLADDVGGVDARCSRKNADGDLESLAFDERKVGAMPVFRTAFDGYVGVFCNEAFKRRVEAAGLAGVVFGVDLGNPFPPDASAAGPTLQ